MSDAIENEDFDAEAQEYYLLQNPAEEEASDDRDQTAISHARNTLFKFILLIRSTELFKLGAAEVTPSLSTSPSYASIANSDEIIAQDSAIVAAFQVSADSPQTSADYEHAITEQGKKIAEIVKNKNLQKLRSFGGVELAAEALNADLKNGISSPRGSSRQTGPSELVQFLRIVPSSFTRAFNNYTVIFLFCAALLSLGFGIKEDGLHKGWFNGGVLMVTVFVIVFGTTIHDCWREWSCKKPENSWHSNGRNLRDVLVVRDGEEKSVRGNELEVGDVAVLRKGIHVPADGLFISTGHGGLELDEGSMRFTTIDENNPFLFYGSRVVNGKARMLVTSTHMDTVWGESMCQATDTTAGNECVFDYLHKLNTCVQIAGLLISILIMIVLFLRYKSGKLDDERQYRPDSKGEPTPVRTIIGAIKGILTGSRGTARVLTTLLSVSLLGLMEGIPFAISIAAIIWSFKTLSHTASERDYFACVKMACVTTIITDKFGGMTEQETEIDKFYVGEEFASESSVVAAEVLEGLCDGIGSVFLVPENNQESRSMPIVSWAEEKLGLRLNEFETKQCTMMSHSGGCNSLPAGICQVLLEKDTNGRRRYSLHCKGSAIDILSLCSHQYDIHGKIQEIDEGKRSNLEMAIRHMLAEGSVEVIAYACAYEFREGSFEPVHLIFLGMISIKEAKTEETKAAVSTLKQAGIGTILASLDDIDVLKPIGQKCGLITDQSLDDEVLTAEEFRAYTEEQRRDTVEKIRILGNCLPSDKILLIKSLREKGQVVALLAQRTADAPALKQADIGITFGTWSSKVARECCDISIWCGDCFGFLVHIVKNGRCFQENIRKFIQLQLIFIVSSSLINFFAVVFWGDAPITAVQLFWLGLVVGLVGGLALLTAPPTAELMTILPANKSSAKLITEAMWRNIVIQVSYQTTIFVTLQNKGQVILGASQDRIKSVIYNGFFLCQMLNKFLAREPERKSFFSGLFHRSNRWFWVAFVVFVTCQAVFALAEELFGNNPGWLDYKLWGACLLIALVSWLLDFSGKIASSFNCFSRIVYYI